MPAFSLVLTLGTDRKIIFRFSLQTSVPTNWNLPLFVSYAQIAIAKVPFNSSFEYHYCKLNLSLLVSYAQIAIAKVPTTIRINPASAFLLNFSLKTK